MELSSLSLGVAGDTVRGHVADSLRDCDHGLRFHWEPVPLRSGFGNINFSSIAAQWREKLESAINSAELVKAVKLPPDKAPACNDYTISWRGCLRWGDSAGAQHCYTCDVLSSGTPGCHSRVML